MPKTAGIILVGNEILSGKIRDENAAYLCRELRALGVDVERIVTIPDAIDVDLIDHPDQPSVGAGEAATSPIPAAIANAIFDATGARVRQVPFTPDRVREALRASKV